MILSIIEWHYEKFLEFSIMNVSGAWRWRRERIGEDRGRVDNVCLY